MIPQIDVSSFPSQIFWLFFFLSVLYCFNRYFFIPRLQRGLEQREETINFNLTRIEELRRKIEKIQSDIYSAHQAAQFEANSIRDKAIAQGQAMIQEEISRINAEFLRELQEEEANMKVRAASLAAALPQVVNEVKESVLEVLLEKENKNYDVF